MGAFPSLFASEPTPRFSVLSLAVVTPSSSSSSEELCSDSESLSMRTFEKTVLLVTGAIREGKTFASNNIVQYFYIFTLLKY